MREIAYLYVDAHYEKVRQDGHSQDAAVLISSEVDLSGHRKIWDVSISPEETESPFPTGCFAMTHLPGDHAQTRYAWGVIDIFRR